MTNMIIGAPNSLDDVQLFSREEIEELTKGAEALLQQGMPPEIPAAIPIGQLNRIVATLKAYRELVVELAAIGKALDGDEDGTISSEQGCQMLESVAAKAAALIDVAPPKPASRIAIPGMN